ncbi:MAG: transcriptional repressor [Deltaproteobacteria bacterium]|nr:transcriptional repressor [Deltaproteobacteria bacterium]
MSRSDLEQPMRMNETEVATRLERLAERCRDAGLAVTPQRLAIYRALLRSESHPDAEALYEAVRTEIPNLSLATVYKNLEALQQLGIIRELTPLHETARFDANLDHHHHLVCTACKAVLDLYDADLDGLQLPPTRLKGFKVSNIRVQVEGLCPECARKQRA